MNFANAKSRYGASGAFEGICNELISYIYASLSKIQLFDAILIDEAQDLPASFFKIVYSVARQPKRIIWAYDELQNLNNSQMAPIDELFGRDENGNPLVSVENEKDEAQRDIILPVCYRNTPWALTLAHALGFGIYRPNLVQLFDELELWKDVGYTVESGRLEFNSTVTMRRRSDSFPSFFNELISPNEAVESKYFNNNIEQYEWVANEIYRNVNEEELDLDDILVIFPNAYSSRNQFQKFNESLSRRGLVSHLAGISTDRDTFVSA